MPERVAKISKQFAANTEGGVAVIVAVSVPVILGFAALALEYGSGLVTKSKNQGTADIAAYAAAFEYNKNTSGGENERVAAAKKAAKSVAILNGVSSGVLVNFETIEDAIFVEVTISEDRPVYLSRFLRPNDSLTINSLSRVALGEQDEGFNPCILALGDGRNDGVTVSGSPSGEYNFTGCGIGSNYKIDVSGNAALRTSCVAPDFGGPGCDEEEDIKEGGFTDPLADFLQKVPGEPEVCHADNTGSLLGDLSTRVSGQGGNAHYQLREGVLCVEEFSGSFRSISSDPNGKGNTLIFKAGVNFDMTGNSALSVIPSKNGDFEGVALYAPDSLINIAGGGGSEGLSINGRSCLSIVARSIRLSGSVTLNLECGEDDANFVADSRGRPLLVQ